MTDKLITGAFRNHNSTERRNQVTKYEIKQIPLPKYRGKHAELKLTLDQMKHGDCIVINTNHFNQARVHNHAQNQKSKKQYYLVSRQHIEPNMIYVWKLEKGVDLNVTNT